MSTSSESWSQQADSRRAAVALTLAIALFVGAWSAIHFGFYRHSRIADTPIYQRYGDAIANGHVPYRDQPARVLDAVAAFVGRPT